MLTAKHLAVQQSLSTGNAKPGDTLTITDSVTLTQYGTANSLTVSDLLPDGLTFASHSGMTVSGSNVAITPVVTTLGDGTTTIVYDVHGQTGDLAPATIINITYTVTVDQTYNNSDAVLAADDLTISSSAAYGLTAGAMGCSDTSSDSVNIFPVGNTLSIINPQLEYTPGDTVIFRHELDISSGDTSGIIFETFFPLPVFDVSNINLTFGNDITHAPSDTISATPDSITVDSATNMLRIVWPDLSTVTTQTISVDIDVTVVDQPFADDLSLTTLFLASTNNTVAVTASSTEPAKINVRAPSLVISHGISATSGDGNISPAPGNPVDSDISGVDAGDQLTFTMTIENEGGAQAHDVTITAALPSELSGATLVSVTDGDSNNLAYSGNASDLFSTGLNITPVVNGNDGSVGFPYSDDAIILTYTALVDQSAEIAEQLTASASVDWSSGSGATKFSATSDDTLITLSDATISVAIDNVTPEASSPNVVVGDTVTYRATVNLPEGTTPNLTSSIDLPAGFEYQNGTLAVDTTDFVGTVDTSPTVATSGVVVSGQSLSVAFDSPSNTVVTNDNNATNNSFSFTFDALVTDSTALAALSSVQNRQLDTSLSHQNVTGSIEDTVSTQFAEHNLNVTSSFSPATALSAGDTVTVTIAVQNTGTASAYDVVISDTLNADLFDLATAAEGTTPAGYTYSYAQPTVTFSLDAGSSLAVGATATFTYTATVKDGVVSGSSYANNPQVTGDSQDGAHSTERDSSDNTSASGAVDAITIADFSLSSSSEAWTSDVSTVEGAIGEVLTYQLTVSVPEALNNESASNDFIEVTLPTDTDFIAGTATIRADNIAVDLTGSSYLAGSSLPTSNTSISPNVNGNVIGFDLGNVLNSDDDADVEQIVVIFDVLVKNTSNNNRTNVKSLTADVHYNNFASNPQSVSQSTNYTVVEADLNVTKVASPTSVTGGDTVTFTATVTNANLTNSSRAWEVTTRDNLPARLENLALTSATLSRGSADISACVTISGQLLTSTLNCLADSERYLAPGENITVVYTADVDINIGFEEQVTNTFEAASTSLPGTQGTASATPGIADSDTGERTGSGVNNTSGEAVNDLTASNTATITAGKPTVNLVVNDASLQILEKTTIAATVAIPVGSTDNFVLTYDLPTGLTYTGAPVVITEPMSNYSASLTPNTALAPATDPLVFDFGTITNSAVTAQNITVEIEVEADNILANQDTTQLSTTVSLDYDGVTLPKPSTNTTITIVEANVGLTKTITAGATGSDAGDTISYQVDLTNSSVTGTAYRVSLVDVLPEELLGSPDGTGSGINFTNITLTNTSDLAVITGTSTPLATGDSSFVTTTSTDDTLTWPLFDLPPTSAIRVTYDVVVSNNSNAGDVLASTATASYNSLLLGGGRDHTDGTGGSALNNYQTSATASLTLDSIIAVQQSLTAGQVDNSFTIGETVSFDIRIDLVEGMTENVVLTDLLPAGLTYVSSAVVAESHISYTGSGTGVESPADTVTFTLGDITNIADLDPANDFLIIRLVAIVDDEAGNTIGTSLNNTATVAVDSSSTSDIETIIIAEPNLVLAITPSLTDVTLGDKVTFTLALTHTASTSDAHETSFDIIVPQGLTYVDASHTGDGTFDDSNPEILSIDLGAITLADGNKSFTFDAIVDNDAEINSSLTITTDNEIYSSMAGTPVVDRSYTFSGAASVSAKAITTIDVQHSATISTDNGEQGILEAGDTIEYTIVLTNNGLPVSNAVYTEAIPNFTGYVAASVTTTQGSINDTSLPELVFDVGAMNTNDVVTLTYQVLVDNDVAAGTQIRAQGSVDSELTVPELSDADNNDSNGDQPTVIYVQDSANPIGALYLQQTAQWLTDADLNGDISPTDIMEITYFIQNTSNTALTNVSIAETLPQGVSYVNSSAVIAGANTINVTGDNVAVAIAQLDAGDVIIASYQVQITNPLFNSDGDATMETFVHTATAQSDQTTPIQSDSNGIESDGNQDVSYTAVTGISGSPQINVYLEWSLVTDVDNDGLVDPGDEVLYQFTVVNSGSSTAQGVYLNDAIPANTSLLVGSSFASQGVVVTESPLAINIGEIAPGGVMNAGFIVTVDGATPDGTVISNQGNVTGSNFSNALSDDNAESADGLNPTLLTVSSGASSADNEPSFAIALVSSTNSSTTGSDFVQNEELSFDITVNVPVGGVEDLIVAFELPVGLVVKPNAAQIKRLFDTGLTASLNPAGINGTATDSFTDVSAQITQNGQVYSLPLGSIINSDNDANEEQYVIRVVIEDDNLVPDAASKLYQVASSLEYINALNSNVTTSEQLLALNFLNRVPVAINDSYTSIAEDSSNNSFNVLTNDTDADTGHNIAISAVSASQQGATVTTNGSTINYSPNADFFGTDTFTYTIIDNVGAQSTATVSVSVDNINDQPIAVNDSYQTNEGSTLTVNAVLGVKQNDSDVENDPLTVSLVSNVTNGTLALNNDGSFVYSHNGGETTLDSFSYRVNDGNLNSEIATVTITVSPVNDAPVAQNDTLITDEDTPAVLDVLNNDNDVDGDTLSVTSVSATHGTVVINSDGTISYTPEANYHGMDTISYCISDGNGGTDCASVTVTINSIADSPIANNDTASTNEDTPLSIMPLNNDEDPDGDLIYLTSASALNGVVIIENNFIIYTPNENFNGTDTIDYCISDGFGGVDCATITVSVNSVNDLPVVVDDTVTINEDEVSILTPLVNDTDIDGDTLSITSATAENGQVVINDDGTLSYTPAANFIGEDVVDYCVSDGNGGEVCGQITVTVNPVNDAPNAVNDAITTNEDTQVTISPLSNDEDIDGDDLTVTSAEALHGTVTIDSEGNIIYLPNENYFGSDMITYCIADTSDSTDCAVINVTVEPVNDKPDAFDDMVHINVDEIVDIAVLANDLDVEEDTLTVTSVTASQGTVSINDDGTIHFIPPLGYEGEIVFTYVITDNHVDTPLTDEAQVTVVIEEPIVEDILAPIAVDDQFVANNWSPITISVLDNDSDPQQQTIRILSASVDIGSIEIVDGQLVYTPVEGYTGDVTIEYMIVNESGITAQADATINFDIADSELYPTITVPDDLCQAFSVDANALYTRVDVGTATAVDRFGNPLPVSVINDGLLFPPGVNHAYWQATDTEGRTTTSVQNVCVKPLVSFEKDKTVIEGEEVTVGVYLNGQSEEYPLTIGYEITGTANDEDYQVTSGELVIESGTESEIALTIATDSIPENNETLIFTLAPELNRGTQSTHTLTITEENIAPVISLSVTQQSQSRLTVSKTGGNVVVDSSIYDANEGDTFSYQWTSLVDNISGAESKFIFDPAQMTAGVYQIELQVFDSGVPSLDDIAVIYIQVVDVLDVLTSADSDGDLIPDNVEGYQDADGDGIPDYLDRISECNVLQEESAVQNQYLVEGDPGVCLRRGEFTFISENHGAMLAEDGTQISNVIPEDTQAINIGGMMDYIAYGLPDDSEVYRIVLPQRKPVPVNAVYRKYSQDNGWGYFVEDDNNSLWSTSGEPGYCPPTGSPLWQPGLNEGDWCVQLIIEDGGANDNDNLVNGTIVDPGYVGTPLSGNTVPVANDDELTLPFNSEELVNVLVNDTDPDGDVLTITTLTANFGIVTIESGTILYQTPPNMVGADVIHYGVADGNGGTDYAVVAVTILPNNPPIAVNDAIEIIEDEQGVIDVLANDSDPDGDALTVVSAIAGHGDVQIDENGILTYTPDLGYFGSDEITYTIIDEHGEQVTAVVSVTIIELLEPNSVTKTSGGSTNPIFLLILFILVSAMRIAGQNKRIRSHVFSSRKMG